MGLNQQIPLGFVREQRLHRDLARVAQAGGVPHAVGRASQVEVAAGGPARAIDTAPSTRVSVSSTTPSPRKLEATTPDNLEIQNFIAGPAC